MSKGFDMSLTGSEVVLEVASEGESMTNKRFDWMTPEEAAKELELDEIVCLILDGCREVLCFNGMFCGELSFDQLRDDESIIIKTTLQKKCICRVILPEVPSE